MVHKLYGFLLLATVLFVCVNGSYAQCSECDTTISNKTISSAYTFAADKLTCFEGTNTITGNIIFGANASVCVKSGDTLTLKSNSYSFGTSGTVKIDIYGTLTLTTSPVWEGNLDIYVHKNGTLNLETITLNGAEMNIVNEGTFNSSTIQNKNASSTITIENSVGAEMLVKETLNLENGGTTYFLNDGNLTVKGNYNSNSKSVYVNCGTYTGQYNLNNGGRVINTGTFESSQVEYGGPNSKIENYGCFIFGNVNMNNVAAVFYNQGVVRFKEGGSFSGGGILEGPSDTTKKGYFVWSSDYKPTFNGGSIGPNLCFTNSKEGGESSKSTMFGTADVNWGDNITWGCDVPACIDLPTVDCPDPQGRPSVPAPTPNKICKVADLTSLEPGYSNVTYEWWTGTSSSDMGTQITSSSTPPDTAYTTVGTVYLWAKSVTDDVYSEEGAPVIVTDTADLSLTKTVSESSPNYGDEVVFTIIVKNSGYCDSYVTVADTLPSGLSYVGYKASNGSYSGNIWKLDETLESGGADTLKITAKVVGCFDVTNSAEIKTSSRPDPDSTPGNGK